jgi:thiamine biosynthesis protein ThiI
MSDLNNAGAERVETLCTFLLKLGELTLKKGNEAAFERRLRENLKMKLRSAIGKGFLIENRHGRLYIRCAEAKKAAVEAVLAHLPGISGWAEAKSCEKTPEAVYKAAVEAAKEAFQALGRDSSFKVEARRTDKSFPLESYALAAEAGSAILDACPSGLRVDLEHPDFVVSIEIREKAYIYSSQKRGLRGLPANTAGRGLLLLSGGIDSPVAGQMLLLRGMAMDALYFHSYPYTSEEAHEKVKRLAGLIAAYGNGMRLYTASFTEVQRRIKEVSPEPWRTVLLRMAMMDCASRLAYKRRLQCLITGESLSQVASQTIENINCTGSVVKMLPVLRPLIGLDKEEIIRRAREMGTYETSIEPYPDCCSLFAPPHPVIHGKVAEAGALYAELELDALLEACIEGLEVNNY